MFKAVIYTRVSTDEQARNGLSLKGQEDATRDYCLREGIEVAMVFCDAGESAKTANRPQLIASMAYCTEHYKEIDFYLVWKMDRLARMAYDTAVIDANLQKLGIQLRSATEPITDSPIGSLTKTMLAGFAQFDNDVRAERSSSGVKRRIEEGGWPHMAPLGYSNYTDSLKRPTLVQSSQAPLITRWLKEYLKGGYTQKASNQLAWDMGIRSKQGTRLSNQQTINMLRNPVYAGLVKSKMIEFPVTGLHTGLISYKEHEAIINKLNKRKKQLTGVSSSQDWPLRGGFIKCAECKENITGSSPKGRTKHYSMYHCPKCRTKTVGHRVSVSKATLHNEFEALLASVTPSEAALKLFKSQVIKKWQLLNSEKRLQQQQMQLTLEKLNLRKQKVITLFVDGSLSSEEKVEQSNIIQSEILRTELKLNEAKEAVISSDILIDFGINMIQNASKLWRISNALERQRLQLAIFPDGLTYNFVSGFGTIKTSEIYQLISQSISIDNQNSSMVGVAGVEPATKWL